MKEEWKVIEGFSKYEVSNFGNIRSYTTKNNGNNLIVQTNKKGYGMILLYKDGKPKSRKVHRLVAQAFIPNLQNKPCVNHKDRNVKNNNVDNLEWCTYKENNNYENCQKRRITSRSISLVINQIKDNFPEEKEVITKLEEIKKKLKEL